MAKEKIFLISLISLLLITIVLISGCDLSGFATKSINNATNTTKCNTINESYTEQEPYTDQECKDVQVPYNAQETYYEKEPYTTQECNNRYLQASQVSFYVNYGKDTTCTKHDFWGRCIEMNVYCVLTVRNIDTKAGTWTYDMIVKNTDLMNEQDLGTQSAYLSPTVDRTITWAYNTNRVDDHFTCYYTITSTPQVTECKDVIKYRDVAKTRTVTKYNTERQCEPVTKYRTVTKYRIKTVCE